MKSGSIADTIALNKNDRAEILYNKLDENFKIKIREMYSGELYEGMTIMEKSEILGTTLTFKFNVSKPVTNITARKILES